MLSLPPSSSSFVSSKRYDVFLSFRGADTRRKFTDHLHAELERKGILTFRDDQLEPGKDIKSQLVNTIRESRCSVIVFSETYAFSGWCLDELVEIFEQKEKWGHEIFPVFYDVRPSDLRYQNGKVQEAFAKHEERAQRQERNKENEDKVQNWRTVLKEVANMSGLHPSSDEYESKFVKRIVVHVSKYLRETYPNVLDDLTRTKSRLKDLHFRLGIGEDDVRIIGICGMGGIGKTTLARIVYRHLSCQFEGSSFLTGVREVSKKRGFVFLQKQLLSQILKEEGIKLFNVHEGNDMISRRLSCKKVLVVIDDVDNIQQLECLVGKQDWFGSGSRIIITTRDEHLLQEVNYVYKPTTLNVKESLHLFNIKAFKSDISPKNDFIELSKQVVEYAGGLPLALEVLGSFLCGRDATQWRSAIERFKRDSNKEIHDRLQMSFDGLEEIEKTIFLDLACFFNGEEKDFVIKVLDGCDFYADIGIDVLIEKSLIKIEENKLRMHNLLQEMGRKIVRQKSPHKPEKRSRLWEKKDIYHVLTKNTAADAIEGITIDNEGGQNKTITLSAKAFLKMKKLRLLKVLNLPNCSKLKYLSNELRLFEWHGYPFKSLPSKFRPDNLVALVLPSSCIEQPWKGNTTLHKLKIVNLSWSQKLINTPDFTMVPNLETLILEGCTGMVDLHPSIQILRKLKLLNLRGCKSLKRFPEVDGQMECLEKIYLDGTGIEELPSSIGHLSKLVFLSLKYCNDLVCLPSSIDGCVSLKILNLSGCAKVESLPENLQQVKLFEELDLSGTAIKKPSSFIFQLENLKVLSFEGCKGSTLMLPPLSGLSSLTELNLSGCNLLEGAIPWDICSLSSLKILNLCRNDFMSLPATLARLSKLQALLLTNCRRLKSVPELVTTVELVCTQSCSSLEVFANPKTASDSSGASVYILCLNCFKLSKNSNALTMLKNFVKVYSYAKSFLSIVIPGRTIPKWFSHQSDESSINIKLTANIRNDSQWMGVAVCCVFVSASNDNDAQGKEDAILCAAVIRGSNGRVLQDYCSISSSGSEDRWTWVKKDHLLLCYWCRDKCLEADNLLSTEFDDQDCDEIFESKIYCHGRLKVKKCGIRIVYEKDLEEMEQIKEQSNSPAFASCEDNGGVLVKRKRNNYDEEARLSESGRTRKRRRPKRR